MSNIDPNDTVVAELDVLVSNQLAALHSQLVLLQQPLRPNWRPYDTGDCLLFTCASLAVLSVGSLAGCCTMQQQLLLQPAGGAVPALMAAA